MKIDTIKIKRNMQVKGMPGYSLVGFTHNVDHGVIDLYAESLMTRVDMRDAVGMHAVYVDSEGALWSDPMPIKNIET